MDNPMRGPYYTTSTASTSPTLTLGELLQQMQRAVHDLDGLFAAQTAQVRESLFATQTAPVKRHKKRRGQKEAYHRRVQKKWTKRYGTKQEPAVYMIDNSVIGGYGRTLVVHPSIAAALRERLK